MKKYIFNGNEEKGETQTLKNREKRFYFYTVTFGFLMKNIKRKNYRNIDIFFLFPSFFLKVEIYVL